MNIRNTGRILFCILAVFSLSAGSVWAKDKAEKEAPLYPNATRKEPKIDMSSGTQKDLNKALDMINGNQNDEALPLVQKIVADPKAGNYAHAIAHQALGQIANDKQDSATALTEFRAAYDADALPNNGQFTLLYNIAILQAQSEKYQDSLSTLDDYFKVTGGGKADAYALQGQDYYRLDKYQPAIDSINKAMSMTDKPNDSWTQILMASYAQLDQYDKAADILEKQLAKSPGDAKLTEQLVKIYVNGKMYDKAEALLDKSKGSLSSDEMYQMYRALGAGYSQENNTEAKAIDAFAKASPYAKTGEVDFYRGSLLLQNDRAKEAVEAIKQAIAKGSLKEPGKAYLMLGDAYNQTENVAEATAAWQKAKAYPDSVKGAEQRLKQGGRVQLKTKKS